MSDFYEGRMIPLKIADMAIINCNKEIEKLQIENARLKSLTAEMDKTINISQAGCRQLKAEVERLTAFTTRTIIPNEELQAQVERLTKAGDWVMSHWSSGDGSDEVRFCQALLKWKNAKEGKQP
jgi:hypothetical protein